ncbi:hypothetical protein FQA39_LY18729 [Lamprigera yunnana]|nr:hypothetical protein FQA39_LY18729 [Lamprigera yunnana]
MRRDAAGCSRSPAGLAPAGPAPSSGNRAQHPGRGSARRNAHGRPAAGDAGAPRAVVCCRPRGWLATSRWPQPSWLLRRSNWRRTEARRLSTAPAGKAAQSRPSVILTGSVTPDVVRLAAEGRAHGIIVRVAQRKTRPGNARREYSAGSPHPPRAPFDHCGRNCGLARGCCPHRGGKTGWPVMTKPILGERTGKRRREKPREARAARAARARAWRPARRRRARYWRCGGARPDRSFGEAVRGGDVERRLRSGVLPGCRCSWSRRELDHATAPTHRGGCIDRQGGHHRVCAVGVEHRRRRSVVRAPSAKPAGGDVLCGCEHAAGGAAGAAARRDAAVVVQRSCALGVAWSPSDVDERRMDLCGGMPGRGWVIETAGITEFPSRCGATRHRHDEAGTRVSRSYAQYFAKFIEAYRAEGIDIEMVMPQNEFNSPQFVPSCTWNGLEGLDLVHFALGPRDGQVGRSDVFFGTQEAAEARTVRCMWLADPKRQMDSSGSWVSVGPGRAQ